MATRLGLASAPAIAEAMAIARDLALAEETGAPVHFRQVTTARGLSLVREAKAKGLPVLCGITPAHLLLSDTAIRSEEHTSELQSLMRISYAVFCLKKKKQTHT